VHYFSSSINPDTWRALGSISDGEWSGSAVSDGS
jgi:hypothetical protein